MVRWDSPLFTVPWLDDDIPADDIWKAVTEGTVKPPNAGTQAVRRSHPSSLFYSDSNCIPGTQSSDRRSAHSRAYYYHNGQCDHVRTGRLGRDGRTCHSSPVIFSQTPRQSALAEYHTLGATETQTAVRYCPQESHHFGHCRKGSYGLG